MAKNYYPVMPKNPVYPTDGTGRDTYISVNNGGTFSPSLKNPGNKRGFLRPSTASISIKTRSLHYISDGCGRDGYIKHNDGGLHANTYPGNLQGAFLGSLRTYHRPTLGDQFARVQSTWKLRPVRHLTRMQSEKVNNCVKRLHYNNCLLYTSPSPRDS